MTYEELRAAAEDAFADHVVSEILEQTERAAEMLVKAERLWALMEELEISHLF